MDSIVYALVGSRLGPAICPAYADYLCDLPPNGRRKRAPSSKNGVHIRCIVANPEAVKIPNVEYSSMKRCLNEQRVYPSLYNSFTAFIVTSYGTVRSGAWRYHMSIELSSNISGVHRDY